MHFFFDECLAPRLARVLEAFDADNQVTHLRDDARFQSNDEDTYIIQMLSADDPRPVLVTADMYARRAERQALRVSGLTCVFMKSGFNSLPFPEQTWKMVKIWSDLVQETTRCREPTAFEVTPKATKVQRYKLTRDL